MNNQWEMPNSLNYGNQALFSIRLVKASNDKHARCILRNNTFKLNMKQVALRKSWQWGKNMENARKMFNVHLRLRKLDSNISDMQNRVKMKLTFKEIK